MKNQKSSSGIPNRRKLTLIESAVKKRLYQCNPSDRFDPVKFIEHNLPKLVKGFQFHYDDEDEVFLREPSRQAVVSFAGHPVLIARESVMEEAYRGDSQNRFILAHEIAHVFLHRKSAAILARHVIGSKEQYQQNKLLELEANLFGGTLLAPPDGISPLMNNFEVRRKFQCSHEVAERAIEDASFWRKQES